MAFRFTPVKNDGPKMILVVTRIILVLTKTILVVTKATLVATKTLLVVTEKTLVITKTPLVVTKMILGRTKISLVITEGFFLATKTPPVATRTPLVATKTPPVTTKLPGVTTKILRVPTLRGLVATPAGLVSPTKRYEDEPARGDAPPTAHPALKRGATFNRPSRDLVGVRLFSPSRLCALASKSVARQFPPNQANAPLDTPRFAGILRTPVKAGCSVATVLPGQGGLGRRIDFLSL